MTQGDSPMADQVPAAWRDKLMHARVTLGAQILMGSDAPSEHAKPMGGFSMSVSVATPVEADRVRNQETDT